MWRAPYERKLSDCVDRHVLQVIQTTRPVVRAMEVSHTQLAKMGFEEKFDLETLFCAIFFSNIESARLLSTVFGSPSSLSSLGDTWCLVL